MHIICIIALAATAIMDVDRVLNELTNQEKVSLLSGKRSKVP